MSVLLWIVLISGAFGTVGLWLVLKHDSKWDKRSQFLAGTGFGLLIGFGLTFIVTGFMSIVIYPSRTVGRTTCRHFAEQSGYPTKFVILNWSDTGTCLARTPDGHWTKNTNIIVNVPAK